MTDSKPRQNTLAREGITSAGSVLAGSKFGQAGTKKNSDQQRIEEMLIDKRVSKREATSRFDYSANPNLFLPQHDW